MDNVAATALAAILGIADPGAATSTQVLIALSGDAERKTVAYECEGVTPFKVEYINAGQNFLAVVPVDGFNVAFVNVLAASGARYVSGQYEWWTKGSDATFIDVTDESASVTCLERVETP